MRPVALAVASLALLAVGCGASEDPRPAPKPAASAEPQDFPKAAGKTLTTLRRGLPMGPVLAPTTTLLEVGRQRVAFALKNRANKQLSGIAVAVYTTNHDGSGVRGPYVARSESLAVPPAFRSQSTARDPDAARSIYVADVPLPRPGRRVITGVARLDGRLVATTGFEVPVRVHGLKGQPPDVGQQAVRVPTDDLASAGGDATKVTTRMPPAKSLVDTQFTDVVGRKPVVLQFSTPLLCQSRVCGPVADVLAQVQAKMGSKAAFIQQEIYRDNEVDKGFRKPVTAWRLPTEPWTFVIDRTGRVSARFEGALAAGELERAVAKVT